MDTGYTLDKDEEIKQRIKKHWIALAPVVASTAVIVIIVVIGSFLAARYRDQIPAVITSGIIGLVMVLLLALAVVTFAIGLWVYRRNYFLLTTKHLIRVEQQGLFHRSVSQLSLSRVQDVTSATPGFLPTILGYGTVTVETAGEEDNFIFTMAPKPSQIADLCLAAHDSFVAMPSGVEHPMQGPPVYASPAPQPAPVQAAPVQPVAPSPAPEPAVQSPQPTPPPPAVEQPVAAAPSEPETMQAGTSYRIDEDDDE